MMVHVALLHNRRRGQMSNQCWWNMMMCFAEPALSMLEVIFQERMAPLLAPGQAVFLDTEAEVIGGRIVSAKLFARYSAVLPSRASFCGPLATIDLKTLRVEGWEYVRPKNMIPSPSLVESAVSFFEELIAKLQNED